MITLKVAKHKTNMAHFSRFKTLFSFFFPLFSGNIH